MTKKPSKEKALKQQAKKKQEEAKPDDRRGKRRRKKAAQAQVDADEDGGPSRQQRASVKPLVADGWSSEESHPD